jgi:hypothetical protein
MEDIIKEQGKIWIADRCDKEYMSFAPESEIVVRMKRSAV